MWNPAVFDEQGRIMIPSYQVTLTNCKIFVQNNLKEEELIGMQADESYRKNYLSIFIGNRRQNIEFVNTKEGKCYFHVQNVGLQEQEIVRERLLNIGFMVLQLETTHIECQVNLNLIQNMVPECVRLCCEGPTYRFPKFRLTFKDVITVKTTSHSNMMTALDHMVGFRRRYMRLNNMNE